MSVIKTISIFTLLLILLTGCEVPPVPNSVNSSGNSAGMEEPGPIEPGPIEESQTETPLEPSDEEERDVTSPTDTLVDRAKQIVMDQAGVAEDAITVEGVVSQDWPDSSLGCPQPGMMYAQVITPGYLITLSTENATYEFHTANNPTGPVVLCSGTR